MLDKVKKRLDILKIDYDLINHDNLHTAEETHQTLEEHGYVAIKNFFLTNRKQDMFYLVSMPHDKPVKITDIAESQGLSRLSFGEDELLLEIMGVTSGSVGAFNLLNVKTDNFLYFIDEDIFKNEYVTFHPNRNDYTIALKHDDFYKYLKTTKKQYEVISI